MPVETVNTRLGIPRSIATRTYLEIASTIRDSPDLRRVIRCWMIPGLVSDFPLSELTPAWLPSADRSPTLTLWPRPRDGQLETNVTREATLNVEVAIYVLSPDPTDAMDLWGLIEDQIDPRTSAAGNALQQRLGAISRWGPIEILQPGSVVYDSDAGPVSVLEGSLSTKYRHTGFGG